MDDVLDGRHQEVTPVTEQAHATLPDRELLEITDSHVMQLIGCMLQTWKSLMSSMRRFRNRILSMKPAATYRPSGWIATLCISSLNFLASSIPKDLLKSKHVLVSIT